MAVDSTSACGPSSSRTARRASRTVALRNRFKYMSVQNRYWRHPELRRDFAVREHADMRQHSRKESPQMWTERRGAEKHRLCHGPGERIGDLDGELLRVGGLERENRTLFGAHERRDQLRFERGRQADRRELA